MKQKLDINIFQHQRRLCALWSKLKTEHASSHAEDIMHVFDNLKLVGHVDLLAKYAAIEKNQQVLDELESLELIYLDRDVKEKNDTYVTYVYSLALVKIATIVKKCDKIVVHINGFSNSQQGGAL